MTRRPWCSFEQRGWLEEHISAFLKAKEAKATPEFYSVTIKKFLSKWPATPTNDELAEAENDQERANHLAEATRGEVCSRPHLKLSAPPKLVQPWQAFQNLLWESELKEKVTTDWENYKATFPEKMEPTE
ncbi:hypothetical protein M378DRAFT_35019, partial [Amanita muscaria Koide BX008]